MPATTRSAPKPRTRAPSKPAREARPRTKPAEVRREELLDAAERLFLEKGLIATSVDDIVSAADVAKGTFYLHFASKEQLLLGLQQRFVATVCSAIEKAIARRRPDDWKGRLRALVQTSMSTYLDQVALHDLVFHEYHPEDRAGLRENPVCQNVATLLSEGTAAGAFDVSDPEVTAIMVFYALHGAADAAVTADASTRKQILRTLESFVMRAVGAT